MSTNLDVEYGSPKVIKTEYIVKKERVACVGGLTLFMSTLAICFTAGLYWNDTNGNVHLQAEHVSSVQQMAANEVNRNAQMATYEAATNARFEKMEKLIPLTPQYPLVLGSRTPKLLPRRARPTETSSRRTPSTPTRIPKLL